MDKTDLVLLQEWFREAISNMDKFFDKMSRPRPLLLKEHWDE